MLADVLGGSDPRRLNARIIALTPPVEAQGYAFAALVEVHAEMFGAEPKD